MNCPENQLLLEHLKGELPEEQREQIEAHLDSCPDCRSRRQALEAVGGRLAGWPDEPLPAGLEQRILEQVFPAGLPSPGRSESAALPPRSRTRLLLTVAATVVCTLLLQLAVWNPLAPAQRVRTVLAFTGPGASRPQGGAREGDLILTPFPDGTFECNRLAGRLPLEELVRRLKVKAPGRLFERLILEGPDPQAPVAVDLDHLEPLLAGPFGIRALLVHSGVRATSGWLGAVVPRAPTPHNRPAVARPLIQQLVNSSRVTLVPRADGRVFLDRSVCRVEALERRLKPLLAGHPELELRVLAEKDLPRTVLMEISAAANRLGVRHITVKRLGQ